MLELSPGGGDGATQDIRVLPVLFDTSEERFRSYDSAVQELAEDEFSDCPIDGPRSTYAVLKQLRRTRSPTGPSTVPAAAR